MYALCSGEGAPTHVNSVRSDTPTLLKQQQLLFGVRPPTTLIAVLTKVLLLFPPFWGNRTSYSIAIPPTLPHCHPTTMQLILYLLQQIMFQLCKQIPFQLLLRCLPLLRHTSPTLFKSAFVGLICATYHHQWRGGEWGVRTTKSEVCVAWDVSDPISSSSALALLDHLTPRPHSPSDRPTPRHTVRLWVVNQIMRSLPTHQITLQNQMFSPVYRAFTLKSCKLRSDFLLPRSDHLTPNTLPQCQIDNSQLSCIPCLPPNYQSDCNSTTTWRNQILLQHTVSDWQLQS